MRARSSRFATRVRLPVRFGLIPFANSSNVSHADFMFAT